jgi:hypothetical protein
MLITTMSRQTKVLPLTTITCARAIEGGDWIVTDAQGEEHRVDKISWQIAVEGTPTSMIPALPGTYILHPGTDEQGHGKAWKTNVLGWMVTADTEVRPLLADPTCIEGNKWDVLHPDGRVERNDGATWDCLDDWIKSEAPDEKAA